MSRVVWAGLHLLDRQLLDREGRQTGNIDDIELTPSDDGRSLYASAIYSGPGALSRRFGSRRLGAWLERMHNDLDAELGRISPIPFDRVTDLGSSVEIAADAHELPADATEKWLRDHFISHIPGSGHAPE